MESPMSDSQKWLILAFVVGVGWLLYRLAPSLMPFAVAAILAYLGDPLVDRLELFRYRNFRLNRTLAVVVVFLGIIVIATGVLLFIIPTIEYRSRVHRCYCPIVLGKVGSFRAAKFLAGLC